MAGPPLSPRPLGKLALPLPAMLLLLATDYLITLHTFTPAIVISKLVLYSVQHKAEDIQARHGVLARWQISQKQFLT